jgi:hypothetical protein
MRISSLSAVVQFFLLGGLAVAATCAEREAVWPLSIPPEHPTLLRAGFFLPLCSGLFLSRGKKLLKNCLKEPL